MMEFLRREWASLTTINPSDRMWQMPFAAALATGLPLLVGAWFGHMDYGLVSSLGGLTFLYLPATPLHHRMVWMMACAFAMPACYALGLISQFFPLAMMPVLVFVAILVTMLCRFYGVGVPGGLFFIMAASIGAYTPAQVEQVPLLVGLMTMGTLLAALIAFFYSVWTLRLRPPTPIAPLPPASFDTLVLDPVVIGLAVGASLALAQGLQLEKAYWVPVSCLAVIQGASLRAVWIRKLHRILGTAVGLLVAWVILTLPLDKWTLSLVMMALTFVVETAVVRHYASAVVFITPLTILLAEAASLGHATPAELIQARFVDTVIGSTVGLVGGAGLHSAAFRRLVGGWLRRLIPARFRPITRPPDRP